MYKSQARTTASAGIAQPAGTVPRQPGPSPAGEPTGPAPSGAVPGSASVPAAGDGHSFGLARHPVAVDADPPPPALLTRHRETVSTGLAVALLAGALGTAWTTARYGDEWAVKSGRTYLETARAELAAAPPGTVFFDQPVPGDVVPVLSAPYNRQSAFFRALGQDGPVFVTEAEAPSLFDGGGRIVPVRIDGPAVLPGPEDGCGYKIAGGRTVRMPLAGPRDDWFWVVRIGYLSSADTTATFRLGADTRQFPIKQGLHQYYFEFTGGGDLVELTVEGHGVTVCTNEVTVGTPVPQQ
ncbi:hypothetical protein C1I99_28665 [Micromonospora deserti]|uniref:Uncharacterized protein n=1 Tax=Micromonospora deserti TaxID=2070366 RepID=A0A2W2BNB7_9ACTN|nr:hypothetical protein C1I99_28665 [Micromonospora deserti]